ncbi:YbaN family protein [Pseudoalteromonas tetraodonis]|uniref:YbaN family protein n=1 Tax=Pseudoalteromonas tetraodonis TaxID=43659 RepID=UPI003D02CE43
MSIKNVFIYYKNFGFKLLGLLCVLLGIIGVVLPVMPTTPFLILALACFARSSAALESWLLNHPRFGTTLQHWRAHQVVPVKAKYAAGIGMLIGFIFLLYSSPPAWVIALVAVVEVLVLTYLISKPSAPPKN